MAKAKSKILIIEDEEYLADIYRFKFEKAGYKVLEARDGQAGLEMCRNENPDLVLLDIIMPVLDGYKTLEALRQDPKIKDLKVYVLSNLGQAGEIKHAMDDGADGYFIKANMTPNQLLEEVRRVLDG